MSFDKDAFDFIPTVESDRERTQKAVCAACGRKMHRTVLIAGEGTEWRHDSTGHAVSWSPSRHNAGPIKVPTHAHRWGEAIDGVHHCTVGECDSEMLEHRSKKVAVELSEKEAHVAESRRRGGAVRRAQTARKKRER